MWKVTASKSIFPTNLSHGLEGLILFFSSFPDNCILTHNSEKDKSKTFWSLSEKGKFPWAWTRAIIHKGQREELVEEKKCGGGGGGGEDGDGIRL